MNNSKAYIYIDTVSGTKGSDFGFNGTVENPVRTYEDAKKLLDKLNQYCEAEIKDVTPQDNQRKER